MGGRASAHPYYRTFPACRANRRVTRAGVVHDHLVDDPAQRGEARGQAVLLVAHDEAGAEEHHRYRRKSTSDGIDNRAVAPSVAW